MQRPIANFAAETLNVLSLTYLLKSPASICDEAGDFYVCTVSGCGVMNFRRISVELKLQANHLFRINQILFSGQVKRFLHIFSGLVAGHRQVVQQIGAAVAGCGSWHFAFKVGHELKRLLHQGQDVLARQVALHQQIVAR